MMSIASHLVRGWRGGGVGEVVGEGGREGKREIGREGAGKEVGTTTCPDFSLNTSYISPSVSSQHTAPIFLP